ncbi:MAG: hypothetical protein ACKORC_04655 [Acidimicrobiia bacterium]
MILWFVGGSMAIVWAVFRDPRFDLRLLAIGALAPDVVDLAVGGAGPAHSVVAPVVVLAGVMAATYGRRPARARLLAVPIGMFLHLVLDGAFAAGSGFWWPLGGLALGDDPLPSAARGWWNVPLEVVGAALAAWVLRARRAARAGR